jgi:hypothetical protein
VESLFTASLHISDFVQTQNEAKILTTCTMKDKVKFYLHHEGQGIKLIQQKRSEYKHIAHIREKNYCLFLGAAT